MVFAVRKGDIDLLEKLLEKKNATMAMTWVSKKLLIHPASWILCHTRSFIDLLIRFCEQL